MVAAAVILPDDFRHPLLNDSKKLTERQRDKLRPVIEREAVAWAVAEVDNEEIDSINILRASILAMHRALDKLPVEPGAVIVDGNRFARWRDKECLTFVKGDGRYANIAAASILAKTAATRSCANCMSDFRSTDGMSTRDIPPPHTVRP